MTTWHHHSTATWLTVIPEDKAEGSQLALYFIAGSALYLWRDAIPKNFGLFVFCILFSLLLVKCYGYTYLTLLPVAYVTIYLGLFHPTKIPIITKGDYSYGTYLYAFPIQQAVAQLLPQMRFRYVNFGITLACVAVCAGCSWHFVEKPVLRLKRFLITHQEHPPETKPDLRFVKSATDDKAAAS